nr:hypothetical protein [Tanacetum cinerariifolium]
MEAIQAFLKKYDHIPPREKCMALVLAEERFVKVKQALEEGKNQPENDEHLDIILKTESDEENVSSVEDLNLTPSEPEDLSDIKRRSKGKFQNLFEPSFDEEIISTKIDPHHFNAESDLIESLLNRDTSIVSSPKFDSLFEDFSGELAHIDLISREIDEADFDPEEEIRLVEKLLYDNSFPRPLEELNFENSDAVIESFSPSPIPVEGSDSLMEEIDIFLAPDDSIPPGIENDDYDSEGDCGT